MLLVYARHHLGSYWYIFKCSLREWTSLWPDGFIIFSIIGHLDQWKFAQKYKIFARVGSQFCQIQNSYSRNGQTLFKFCPSCKISPNLVTLEAKQKREKRKERNFRLKPRFFEMTNRSQKKQLNGFQTNWGNSRCDQIAISKKHLAILQQWKYAQ